MSETETFTPTNTGSVLGDAPAGAMGHNGGPDWLPEELRSDASLAKFKDVAGLAKSYSQLEKRFGVPPEQLLKLPSKEDAPEWGEVFDKLGRPKDPKGYEFAAPPGVPEPMLEGFRGAAHQAGLNPRQAARVMEFYGQAQAQAQEMQAAQVATQTETAAAELKGEWGARYDATVHNITRAIENFGGKEALAAVNDAGLGRSPQALRMLAKMADALAEAGALKGGSGGAQPAVSPEQAREAVSRKYMDGEFMAAYMGSDHPGHAAAVREMEALFAAAHSGTQG
ncbi:hypothetical protein UFOVP78_8 [uncultured Caudovirales phage]|uniref:Uncharacterized protein n=1 Tax=uncultured Caudovirales phage TaxID=2100421 RepID=A0A6J5KZC8_9CAUD|nr:hypothetical protein UFOVP78_8 [uncultured Caudovirales phage]